jgi:hypothetical protein
VGFEVNIVAALGQVSLRVLPFSLSVPFHRGYPYSCICGMNNRPVGDHSLERYSHLIAITRAEGLKCLIFSLDVSSMYSVVYLIEQLQANRQIDRLRDR